MAEDSKYMRYFLYSREQMKIKKSVQEKLGKRFKLGTVIVKGLPKEYTEISTDPKNVKFSDTEIVVYGDIRELKYTKGD
jgi:hypothetical protein